MLPKNKNNQMTANVRFLGIKVIILTLHQYKNRGSADSFLMLFYVFARESQSHCVLALTSDMLIYKTRFTFNKMFYILQCSSHQ